MLRLQRHWYLWVPICMVLLEAVFQNPKDFLIYHYWQAFHEQPGVFFQQAGLAVVRIFGAYILTALALELLFNTLPQSHLVFRGLWRPLIWCLIYSAYMRWTFANFPAVAGLYNFYLPKWIFRITLIGLLIQTITWTSWQAAKPLKGRTLGALFAILVALLWVTKPSAWTLSGSAKKISSSGPSFFLIGFDGVPQDLWKKPKTAPQWHAHWKDQGIQFERAYSPSNSTFTSWFSLLSGQLPIESGVEFLYPENREGQADRTTLLPNKLKKLGYRTVYMTDCAATSYMQPEYGFDELFQIDSGVFECGRSLLTGNHPATYILSPLFPEHQSFCSATYQADKFVRAVTTKRKELEKAKQPYLLAMHSCVSHHQLHAHQPSESSELRKDLDPPSPYSQPDWDTQLALRRVDNMLTSLLADTAKSPNLWRLFFADHGSRMDHIDGRWKHFTHAVGLPKNRYQYNVPLAIFGPETEPHQRHDLVTLTDIGPWIYRIATGEKVDLPPREELVMTSAVPIPFGNKDKLVRLFRNNRVKENGHHYFSERSREGLLKNRPIAYLKWPYRLMGNGKGWKLFREDEDPENRYDIAPNVPETVFDLKKSLCDGYSLEFCPSRRLTAKNLRSTQDNE